VNRAAIAHQVSLTLGDYTDSFDLDAILDDLAEAGAESSVDDISSDTYWAIIERHDTGALTEAAAVEAHTAYLKAEAACKRATATRQVAFAKALDARGRGGNASLAHKLSLSPPTVKGIADRGRELLADPFKVHAWEDNAGQVYIQREGENAYWYLGMGTADMDFADEAEAWHNGDWQPNENDGQELDSEGPREGHVRIATWTPARGIEVARKWNGDIEAGAGGQAYLGIDEDGNPLDD
jgi:hypothetical protein